MHMSSHLKVFEYFVVGLVIVIIERSSGLRDRSGTGGS